MATALFIVIQSRGKWYVDFEGRSHGPHETIELAALEARKQALFAVGLGRPAEVFIPDRQGKFHSIWDSRKQGITPRQPTAPAPVTLTPVPTTPAQPETFAPAA